MCSGATVIFGLKAPLPEVISAFFEQKGRDRQNHGAGGKTLGLSTTGWPVAAWTDYGFAFRDDRPPLVVNFS